MHVFLRSSLPRDSCGDASSAMRDFPRSSPCARNAAILPPFDARAYRLFRRVRISYTLLDDSFRSLQERKKNNKRLRERAVITEAGLQGFLRINFYLFPNLALGPELVIHQSKECLDNMGEWCREHHAASGLTTRVLQSTTTEKDAEEQLRDLGQATDAASSAPTEIRDPTLGFDPSQFDEIQCSCDLEVESDHDLLIQVINFVKDHVGSQSPLLAGNSVYVDFMFLKLKALLLKEETKDLLQFLLRTLRTQRTRTRRIKISSLKSEVEVKKAPPGQIMKKRPRNLKSIEIKVLKEEFTSLNQTMMVDTTGIENRDLRAQNSNHEGEIESLKIEVAELVNQLAKAKEFENSLNGRNNKQKDITENLLIRFKNLGLGADPAMPKGPSNIPTWKSPVVFVKSKGKAPMFREEDVPSTFKTNKVNDNGERSIPTPSPKQ
ncbi:Oligoribonuclease [Platanthera guangdongensis]|uniref:Oligoribonuclease n=1 Tax=Platanthera guangdongensis TaxID=2320717 RepID=A0ABR2LFI3_9ASPA